MTAERPVCMGGFVARVWHDVRRRGSRGVPLSRVWVKARLYGLNPYDVVHSVRLGDKVSVVFREGRRWLVRGPSWDPTQRLSEAP